MAKIKGIDRTKCIGCARCVRDCVASHLFLSGAKATMRDNNCIGCGHCYAVCPVEAITMDSEEDCGELVDLSVIDSHQLLQGMKSRRSIRCFKAEPVEQEKLDMIIEAGRYSPTGSNAENVAFTILGSKQPEIEAQCVEIFRRGAGIASPILSYLKNFEIDDHFFFKGAPLVIVVSSRSDINAGIACGHMELMANSLGLGVLYSGFFVVCTALSAKIKKTLDLPDGHKVHACMVIGYPDMKYLRIPPRKPAKVKTL